MAGVSQQSCLSPVALFYYYSTFYKESKAHFHPGCGFGCASLPKSHPPSFIQPFPSSLVEFG